MTTKNMAILQERDLPRTPELSLWRAVIEQHLRDGVNNLLSARTIRDEARAWFARRGTTYRYVCELAGFDPDQLAEKAKAQFQKADNAKPKQPRTAQPNPSPKSRQRKLYYYNGQSLTLTEWAVVTGISQGTLQSRVIQLGWPIEQALSKPTNQERARRLKRIASPPAKAKGTDQCNP